MRPWRRPSVGRFRRAPPRYRAGPSSEQSVLRRAKGLDSKWFLRSWYLLDESEDNPVAHHERRVGLDPMTQILVSVRSRFSDERVDGGAPFIS